MLSVRKLSSIGEGNITNLAKEVVEDITSFEFHILTANYTQDCTAHNDTDELDLDPDKCAMHQGDKIGKSTISKLVRCRSKVIVNQFPVGEELLKKLRDSDHNFVVAHNNRLKNGVLLKTQTYLQLKLKLI